MRPAYLLQLRPTAAWLALVLLLQCPAAASGLLEGAALVRALRAGGHHIYFRHAQTDWTQTDRVRERDDWLSCDPARVRQLSPRGRETARAIGRAMHRLAIPVGRVIASPYCRTRETARLLGLGPVEVSTAVMNLRAAEFFGGRTAIVRTARLTLAEAPRAGTNQVIVAHGNVAREATSVYPGEAGAVVFRPDGDGGFEVVAQLTPDQWSHLAGAGR